MNEICPTTGELCEASRMLADSTVKKPQIRLISGKINMRIVEEIFEENRQDLVERAQQLCTERTCGLVALGSVLAINQLALEQTKAEVNS